MPTGKRAGLKTSRLLLSVFLAYHLVGAAIGPNAVSYLYRGLEPLYRFHWNALDYSTSWGFFAPEPGPLPLFIEWEMEVAGSERRTGTLPEFPSPYWNRERQTRRGTMSRFLLGSDSRVDLVLGTYLCRLYPEAISFTFWRRMHGVPALEPFAKGERHLSLEPNPTRTLVNHSFCEGRS